METLFIIIIKLNGQRKIRRLKATLTTSIIICSFILGLFGGFVTQAVEVPKYGKMYQYLSGYIYTLNMMIRLDRIWPTISFVPRHVAGNAQVFEKNLNESKPFEHPPSGEKCLKA